MAHDDTITDCVDRAEILCEQWSFLHRDDGETFDLTYSHMTDNRLRNLFADEFYATYVLRRTFTSPPEL